MRKLRAALNRLASLFHRESYERELTAEMESHLQLHMDDNLWYSVSPHFEAHSVFPMGQVLRPRTRRRSATRNPPGPENWLSLPK